MLSTKEHPVDIDTHQVVPLFSSNLMGWLVHTRDPRVVHQDRNLSKFGLNFVHDHLAIRFVCDVKEPKVCSAARHSDIVDELIAFVDQNIRHRDRCAFSCEHFHARFTNAK